MEIQELAIELGVEDPFHVVNPRIWEGQLTSNSWIASICEYIKEQGFEIRFPVWSRTRLLREEDKYIMEEIANLNRTDMMKKDLQNFNICRLFKRVHSMTEIMDSSGMNIADRAWNREKFDRGTNEEFRVQHNPTDKQWDSWKKGLRALQRRNRYQLGRWTIQEKEEDKWDFFLDSENRRLLLKEQLKWYSFETLNRRWTGILKFNPEPSEMDQVDITGCQRVTVKIQEHWTEIESLPCQAVYSPEKPESLSQLIRTLTPLSRGRDFHLWFHNTSALLPETYWSFKSIRFKGNMETLLQDFENGRSLLVGDGSRKGGRGAGASLIASETGNDYIMVSGPTPGDPESQSPYRSEIGSLVGCSLLRLMLSIATRSHPKVTLACDNEKALRKVQPTSVKITSSTKHADLITAMNDIWKVSNGQIILEDVKSHADEEKVESELTVMERLNSLVDIEAKLARAQAQCNIHRTFSPLVGIGMIFINNIPIIDNQASRIQEYVARRRSRKVFTRTRKIQKQHLPLIDEATISEAMNGIPINRQIFLTKWVAKQLPVGKILRQRNHSLTDTCPLCLDATEDHHHLIQCESISATSKFEELLTCFEEKLERLQTSPELQIYLIQTLRLWRQDLFRPFAEQEKIGWDNFLLGIISSGWADAQQLYFEKIGISKYTGTTWAKQMVRALWEITYEIWKHRNDIVHHPEKGIERIQGEPFLNEAISKEYNQGFQGLHRDFRHLFTRQSLQELLAKSMREKKVWFQTIRTTRERTNTAEPDLFSVNGPLRSWIGLPRIKT